MKDIAERVGVSLMTVSAALGGNYPTINVSQSTRQRIVDAARDMGYRPNRMARAMVTGRTHVIALWAQIFREPYFARMVDLVQGVIKASGYEIIISHVPESPAWDEKGPPLWHWPVDGIVAFEWPSSVDAYLDADPAFHVPLVSIGAYYTERADCVGIDYYTGAREATQHLIESGCRSVLYVLTEFGRHLGDDRYRAYTEVMHEVGMEPECLIVADARRADARSAMADYLRANRCPDGIFFFCDEMALGGFRALCDAGLRIPDDVRIVGCDGIEDTEYLEPPLSTIVPPVEEMCVRAWEFLQARIAEPGAPPQHAILPSHLVKRRSSCREMTGG
jgi:LacI family transcriptional regulator